MRVVKCPEQLVVGDRLWFWNPERLGTGHSATIVDIVDRRVGSVTVELDDHHTVEIFVKHLVPVRGTFGTPVTTPPA